MCSFLGRLKEHFLSVTAYPVQCYFTSSWVSITPTQHKTQFSVSSLFRITTFILLLYRKDSRVCSQTRPTLRRIHGCWLIEHSSLVIVLLLRHGGPGGNMTFANKATKMRSSTHSSPYKWQLSISSTCRCPCNRTFW